MTENSTFIAAQVYKGLHRLAAHAATPVTPPSNKRSNPDFADSSPAPSPSLSSSLSPPVGSLNEIIYGSAPVLDNLNQGNSASAAAGSMPKTSRVKSITKRHRPSSSHSQALPLSTIDLSHTTFRGDHTYAPTRDYNNPVANGSSSNQGSTPFDSLPPFMQFDPPSLPFTNSINQQQYQPDNFQWQPSNTYASPPPLQADQSLPNYAPLAPNTEALFNSISAFPESINPDGHAAGGVDTTNYGFEYPFTFGDLPMNQSDDWGEFTSFLFGISGSQLS
jgi:hypothetical protein